MSDVAVRDVATLFNLDPAALRCPYPYFERVRDDHPVVFVPEIECWLVTRYADIVYLASPAATWVTGQTVTVSGAM